MIESTGWLFIYSGVLLTAIILTALFIPQILVIAFKKNLFDEITARKIHQGAVPRLGGVAFFPSLIFAILLVMGIASFSLPDIFSLSTLQGRSISFMTCAAILMYLVGFADDLISLPASPKFVAMLIASALVACGGIVIDNMHGLFSLETLSAPIAATLAIILIFTVINAINFLDGINGLAAGLCAVACAYYAYIFFMAGLHIYALIAVGTVGTMIAFFYFNVFGDAMKRKKIFMGDSGALTIGIALGILGVRASQLDCAANNVNASVAAFSPLIIPCFDIVRVFFHRWRTGVSPFTANNTHIHHKLMGMGLSRETVMPILIAAEALYIILNCCLSSCASLSVTIIFFIDLAIWIVANLLISLGVKRYRERTGDSFYK